MNCFWTEVQWGGKACVCTLNTISYRNHGSWMDLSHSWFIVLVLGSNTSLSFIPYISFDVTVSILFSTAKLGPKQKKKKLLVCFNGCFLGWQSMLKIDLFHAACTQITLFLVILVFIRVTDVLDLWLFGMCTLWWMILLCDRSIDVNMCIHF